MVKAPTLKMKKSMAFIMAMLVIVGYTTIIIRLFYLQILNNDEYQKLAIEQQLRDTTITAQRGTIYDANMKVLAKSATIWTVHLAPKEIKKEQIEVLAENLSKILDVDKNSIIEKSKKHNFYQVVKRKVEKDKIDQIREFITKNDISGIHITEDSKRYYPYGDFAASILGFTGVDGQGLAGIEAYYDKYLKGVDGRIVTATNAIGTEMPFEYEKLYEPQQGNDVVLTIDETIQHYLEKYLSYAVKEHSVTNKGAGIVMNVNTGEILAMATKPDFDPNNPFEIYDPIKKAEVDALPDDKKKEARAKEQQQQWRNKVVSDLYEPGSVFKVVTAAAGLEENVITLQTPFNCVGSLKVAGIVIRCNKTEGHGHETFSDGFRNSCNPVFMEVAAGLGSDKFFQYLQSFGLTEKTEIDLPGEEQSVFYTPDKTGPVELASQSFGQSNKFTPIQISTAVATAINGGNLIQPHVVKKVIDRAGNVIFNNTPSEKRQVISKETSNQIIEVMERVVKESPGSKNAKVLGYRVIGKSGTSQKLDGDENDRIASFVAAAPAENPQILCLIILDEPHSYSQYGSVLSAPVAGNVLADTLPYLGILPNYTEEELTNKGISVPNLVGRSINSATMDARKKGLKVRKIGDSDVIVSQFPPAGHKVPLNSTVIVYTEQDNNKELVEVPNVTGMTILQATDTLKNKGLNIRVEGNIKDNEGYAEYQSIVVGEKIPIGSVVTVNFINKDG